MARETEPTLDARGYRFGVVAARFNHAYVRRLVDGALESLRSRGATEEDLEVTWVPGSFELPLACRWVADSGRVDAVLALGVVIRGETEHFRLVVDTATRGLLDVMLSTGVPVVDGVLAVYDAAQAEARCGGTHGNRGSEVALAAIAMAELRRRQAVR